MAEKKKLVPSVLISEELLKLYSPLSKNVGVDKIVGFIPLAQDFYIQPILGSPLMTELQEQIDSNTLTDENKALLIKVASPLALYSTYLAMRSLVYSLNEKGATKEHSENSDSLNENEVANWRMELKDMAELATKSLIKYLCNCRDLYELWRPESDCQCNEFDDGDGNAQIKEKDFHVYFPNGVKDNGCGCDNDFIK